jgi:ABC-type antimicrobial peptide transport system permease subunit
VRMALGAQPGDGLRAVLKEGLRPVVVGVVCAGMAAEALRGLLYGVGPLDPAVLGGVAGVLLLAAAVACWVPGRRASRLDPTAALRHE